MNNNNQKETILSGRLDGKQRNRLKGLFDMLYKPGELADEIGISIDQIYRVYIPLGCPIIREERRHFLLNGKDFRDWYLVTYQKTQIKDNETFCKTCKKAVDIYLPENRKKGDLSYILSVCPICGRKLSKIINCEKGKHD